MNYCDKIHYGIYSTEKADFGEMVEGLLAQLPRDRKMLRLVFFGAPHDNNQYVERRGILREKMHACFGNNEPVLTYVSQPSLNGGLVLEAHMYSPDKDESIAYRCLGDLPYVVVTNDCGRFLFAGGIHGDVVAHGMEQQSKEVFRQVAEVMEKENFPINSIVRQWNYIEQITAFDGVDQHYQILNNARSEYYAATTWKNGYPAATGIGANLGGLLVDLDAAVFSRPECYATPIDNKLQVAAHAYSDGVLEVAKNKKTTPKFERAKSMTFDGRKLIYVSGTAAIRGEESLKGVGLERQLHTTMENIAELTGDAALKMLRVYLKDKSFYDEAARLMKTYGPDIPISYMWADICREELLIEIEGIAIK